jgi:hypothetical protein
MQSVMQSTRFPCLPSTLPFSARIRMYVHSTNLQICYYDYPEKISLGGNVVPYVLEQFSDASEEPTASTLRIE